MYEKPFLVRFSFILVPTGFIIFQQNDCDSLKCVFMDPPRFATNPSHRIAKVDTKFK